MTALVRYQLGLLLRSYRWVGPVVLYATGVVFIGIGGAGGQPLATGLDWSAAVLVPTAAWLTRSALTAEPTAARACTAAAGGAYRTHLSVLLAGLGCGAVLALAGAAYQVARDTWPHGGTGPLITTAATGLATAAICLGVGSAVAAACNPPVVRRTAYALLSTSSAVIIALVAGFSPANATLQQIRSHSAAPAWLPGLVEAALLLGLAWALSTMLAVRRAGLAAGEDN